MSNLVLFGGTFDPVHNGHLQVAMAVQNHFHFERFILLPCKQPVLKNKAIATASQRVEMLNLAFQSKINAIEINELELQRDTPSYTIDTLMTFRERNQDAAISLLVGLDAFKQLPKWHRWNELLNYAHILVTDRADASLSSSSEVLLRLLKEHETTSKMNLLEKTHGHIYRFNAGHYPISSTFIREQLKKGISPLSILPHNVLSYIQSHHLYHICKK